MGTNKVARLVTAAIGMLLWLTFPVLVTNAQSVAEAAKQQRARFCKEGKTQYCYDGPKSDKPKIVVNEQGPSEQAEEQGSFSPESSQGLPSVGELQDRLDDLSGKTPRQLGDGVVGNVQFPGRDRWELRLGSARDKLVSKIQVVLDLLRLSQPNPIALNNAVLDMRVAGSDYRDVQTDGYSAAADWKRKTQSSASSKFETKQPH